MTIHTWNMVVTCMDLMAKRDRLGRRVSLITPRPHEQVVAKHQESYGVKQAEDLSAHRTSSGLVKNFANFFRLHVRSKFMGDKLIKIMRLTVWREGQIDRNGGNKTAIV